MLLYSFADVRNRQHRWTPLLQGCYCSRWSVHFELKIHRLGTTHSLCSLICKVTSMIFLQHPVPQLLGFLLKRYLVALKKHSRKTKC